ncbi:MAG TPA: hypothetical protein VLA58_06590 [Chitinophagaceae bacterium]|nr:hypothetical protein [Chitinophagaceae bacterium]
MKIKQILAVIATAFLISCNQADQSNDSAAADTIKPVTEITPPVGSNVDEAKVLGTWVRTDSPYEIRILEFRSDGTILAGYFNPKSINVGKATWSKAETVYVYVELQDENYPGSNYLLKYNPDQDQLTGKYFQAVEGVTYDVAFSRKQ